MLRESAGYSLFSARTGGVASFNLWLSHELLIEAKRVGISGRLAGRHVANEFC
jgi:hypothetical protein